MEVPIKTIDPVWIIVALSLIGGVFAIGQWVGRVNADRSEFKKVVETIHNNVVEILARLSGTAPVASGSPLRLNDLGCRVAEQLGALALARDIAGPLQPQATGKPPYDIQLLSFDFVRDKYEPPEEVESKIRQCAYEHGMSRGQVLDVLAILVRDELLGDQAPEEPCGNRDKG